VSLGTTGTLSIKMHDKLAALIALGKHLGMPRSSMFIAMRGVRAFAAPSRFFNCCTLDCIRRRSLRQFVDECLSLCRSAFRRSRFCYLGQGQIIAHRLANHVYYSLRSDQPGLNSTCGAFERLYRKVGHLLT